MSKIVSTSALQDLPAPDYKYITSTEEALKHLEFIEKHPIIEIDTETTGLDPFMSKVVLLQAGVNGKAYVFDIRDGRVDASIFKPMLEGRENLKLLQNAVFDCKMLKANFDIEINRIYDTMLAEQLLYLGLHHKSNLQYLVSKYLHLNMPKEIGRTFQDYDQEYKEYQLRYAANDVVTLKEIYNLQLNKLQQDGLMRVAQLEFDFIKPLMHMELNGMLLDIPKWKDILGEITTERDKLSIQLADIFNRTVDQNTLFGVSLLNLDSPIQVVKCLNDLGVPVESSDVKELNKYIKNPVVELLLNYRKSEKFITTYGDPMIDRMHSITGRLHTSFKQMVDTGRLSSSNPNLQNIPKQQKYRSCFIARPGYKLVTCDMSQAELRILGDYSGDPVFLDAFANDLDLHTRTAADLFGLTYEEVVADKKLDADDVNKKNYRANVKSLNFGLVYGLTKVGLALRMGTSENEAQKLITSYFNKYPRIKRWLDRAAKSAVMNRYSTTISGRRRYYRLPEASDPQFNRMKGSVERQGKNQPIQGCVGFNTVIKGCGVIGELKNKIINNFETGLGYNSGIGVYSGKKLLYEMKLSNGVKLNITLDHKVPVIDKTGEIVDKKVSDIDIRCDVLLIPLNVVDGDLTDLSGYKYVKGHWRETYVEYKYPSIMNKKLAFIIGCLIGDGNYSTHNYIQFVCPGIQKELFIKFNSYIEDVFGYPPVIDQVPNKKNVLWNSQVSSVVIRGFLKHIGLDYVTHRNKSIPSYFLTESLSNKGALLDGLFSTDGGVTSQSGPNYTTVSCELANNIHQLLFSVGINSNLKEYSNKYGPVYRIQIPKRFIDRFLQIIGASVDIKHNKLVQELSVFNGKDNSIVPDFISFAIYNELRNSNRYNDLNYNEKCHLRRFKYKSCSFTSWRKFYKLLPESPIKKYLRFLSDYDFCKITFLSNKYVESDAYDILCYNDPHYFIGNGVLLHNSNADTIKQTMCYVVDRIKPYDAQLLSTVHDETITEVRNDQVEEVKNIIEKATIDGFGTFFSKVKMKADADVADYWVKG